MPLNSSTSFLLRNRKLLITLVVIANLSFILNLSYILYFKEALFDTTQRPVIETKEIDKIEIREGSWKWADKTWEFGHSTKMNIAKPQNIKKFCDVLRSSPAKYIDNIRGNYWLYIYFTKNEKEDLLVVLSKNHQGEVFFEYENNTYDGQQLAELVKELAKENNL